MTSGVDKYMLNSEREYNPEEIRNETRFNVIRVDLQLSMCANVKVGHEAIQCSADDTDVPQRTD